MNKYGSQKTELDGHSFSSKLEASVYGLLKALGYEVLQCQDHVYLTDARILYIPDFKFKDNEGQICWGEAKGFEKPEWRIKRRLWQYYGPGPLHIYKGSHQRPYLDEVLPIKKTSLVK